MDNFEGPLFSHYLVNWVFMSRDFLQNLLSILGEIQRIRWNWTHDLQNPNICNCILTFFFGHICNYLISQHIKKMPRYWKIRSYHPVALFMRELCAIFHMWFLFNGLDVSFVSLFHITNFCKVKTWKNEKNK